MSNVWTEDDTEKLIALFEQYQCLWNLLHPEFNNNSLRYEAYKEIRNSMNIPGLKICDYIKRIENAKKEYCYELSKIAAAISCEKLYTPKAKWFKIMHTLFFPYMSISHYNNVKKYRDTVPSAPKLQDAAVSPEMIQTIDVATETSNSIVAEYGTNTQPDLVHERKYIANNSEEKKDCSTFMDDSPTEVHNRKKIEDNFEIFGKSIAFQLRTIDIQPAMELENEIQNLVTKTRLKILDSKLPKNQNSNSMCCCNCNACKVCRDEICSCGLTLKECLLLTKIKENEDCGCCCTNQRAKGGKKFTMKY